MPKKAVTIMLDPEDLQTLEDKSRETGLSLSGLIRLAVKEWLKQKGEKA